MKSFLVTLTLFLGEYEKTAKHLVVAKNKESAGKKALRGECHNNPKRGDWQGSHQVDDDCFTYRVASVTEVTAQEAEILRKYL
jgi:hypothetical protein